MTGHSRVGTKRQTILSSQSISNTMKKGSSRNSRSHRSNISTVVQKIIEVARASKEDSNSSDACYSCNDKSTWSNAKVSVLLVVFFILVL